MKNNYHWKDAGFKNKIMAAVIHFHLWPFFLWLYISYLVRKSSPQRQANGSLPSACIMAVCVRNVAASRYIRRHIGQGRGSWKANLRGGSPPRGSKPVNERTIASKWLSGRGGISILKLTGTRGIASCWHGSRPCIRWGRRTHLNDLSDTVAAAGRQVSSLRRCSAKLRWCTQ